MQPASEPAVSRPARIVVINDAPDFLDVVTEILEVDGYAVIPYAGEDLSVDELASRDPDLVILDLRLWAGEREISGWEFMLLIRSHDALREVPVIVCSADSDQLREREEELQEIANSYVLPKPFEINELEQMVRAALDGSHDR
jgi:DNA-binding response OmpR family regulator